MNKPWFEQFHLEIVQFCADECARQHSGEQSVARMVNGYNYALRHYRLKRQFNVLNVQTLGQILDPRCNRDGYRIAPITIDGMPAGIPLEQIPRAIQQLMLAANDCRVTPEEFYQEFERIHPFRDGNGRAGAILYNFYNQTLERPMTPPVFVKEPV